MAHPAKMKAVRVHEFGAPEVLKLDDGHRCQSAAKLKFAAPFNQANVVKATIAYFVQR